MVSFERKHYKYDMHIYFNASFIGIHLSLSLKTKTIPHKVFVRTIGYLYVSLNNYPHMFCAFIYIPTYV